MQEKFEERVIKKEEDEREEKLRMIKQ